MSAFFYGTLMHPKILQRVIGNNGNHLEICPAVLMGYTRHHVKWADYPAILPYEKSKHLFKHDLSAEENSVRGTLVIGLTQSDIEFLDVFEGDEYSRTPVFVHRLGPLSSLASGSTTNVESDFVPTSPPPLTATTDLSATLPAETYVWKAPVSQLEDRIWSFETFVKENAWKWVGSGPDEVEEYGEVDRRREMGGSIVRSETAD
ncbi:hypothetical protein BV25DRAFT_1822215 [Artomyces pyxidatus]|uniref:Uncharacterized protein n=1 Tax=Artomyces pyxidatus TaxID=48021 RepID=A0ACB8TAA0_9AGAM|nr:hypothetical protein BV25DRAFT_1822215 [Artomyces pyxidatus]